MYIYIYIPYIPYCQPFCLEPPEPETIHWKPGKNFFYLKLKKRWMSKWKIWRSKTGGIWEGHRASMSWGRGVEQCLPQEMHESPRSGDFYPFQRCMFDQFFQDVLLCMFWPTQLRQFQECGGWIRVKLHTRLYTGHSPPPHTHTQKKTPQQRRYQKITCFLLGGDSLHRTNFPVTCSSRSGWRRMQKKWSKWPVRPTIEFQISRLVYTGRAMETPSPFFNKW